MRQVIIRSWYPTRSTFNYTCRVTSSELQRRALSTNYYRSASFGYPAKKSIITSLTTSTSASSANTLRFQTRHIFINVNTNKMASATTFYDFKPKDKKGVEKSMADFQGKVVLVVNTASKCGFTPQYAGLEKLYKDVTAKHPDDFVIVGFPCNQFGGQEPGTDDDIQSFCQVNYGVTFPIMGKTDVNGDKAEPLFEWMKAEKPGLLGMKRVKWNFEKFLIGRDGKVKERWASTTKPESLEKTILEEIEKKA
ncbi:thioredoxin-like protein [Hypoxylon crocopeplum]|nr:thioredoxin-like protein [Hypoxylon crocopeplum]